MAAAADAVFERADDDSHTNLYWDEDSFALVGREFEGGHRIGLQLAPLAISVLKGQKSIEARELAGTTLLLADAIVAVDSDKQSDFLDEFLHSAIGASMSLLSH